MKKQRGISLSGLLLICVVLIAVVLIAIKLVPAYTEYFAVKKAVNQISSTREAKTQREVVEAFERRAAIDDIRSVRGTDLEVSRQGDRVAIGATWSVKVPLFYNISACIDFDVRAQ